MILTVKKRGGTYSARLCFTNKWHRSTLKDRAIANAIPFRYKELKRIRRCDYSEEYEVVKY